MVRRKRRYCRSMNYWLLKSEPHTFSIDDLAKAPKQITSWDGVRNYQARNFLQQMQVDDLAFFYHSSAKPSGIVGIVKVIKAARADKTALDPSSDYFDPREKSSHPRWY